MRYLVGIDGGGSGTRARLVAADGQRLGEAQSGPSSLSQGVEAAWRNIEEAIAASFASAGMGMADRGHCALGLGLSGASVPSQREALLRHARHYGRVAVETDSYAALLGAHEGRPGAILVAGTGSAGEALRRDGSRVLVGGWGFPVGDEGSGAWLGLAAMRIAQQAMDGRGGDGALARAVWQHAGTTRETLLAWCARAGQNAYGQLAPLVFDTETSDPASVDLVFSLCHAIEAHFQALDPAGELPLCLHGSVGARVAGRLAPSIGARLVAPRGDALDGALRLLETVPAGAAA